MMDYAGRAAQADTYPKLLRQPMDAEVVGIVGEWLAAQTASR